MILRMVNICHLRGMLRAIAILQHYYCIKMTYQYCHFFVSILNMLQAANYLSTCIQASSLLHNTCSLPFSWASTFLIKLSNRQGEFVLSEGIFLPSSYCGFSSTSQLHILPLRRSWWCSSTDLN